MVRWSQTPQCFGLVVPEVQLVFRSVAAPECAETAARSSRPSSKVRLADDVDGRRPAMCVQAAYDLRQCTSSSSR